MVQFGAGGVCAADATLFVESSQMDISLNLPSIFLQI
jgi:hypothetical protein